MARNGVHHDSLVTLSTDPVMLLATAPRLTTVGVHPFLLRLIAIINAAGGADGAQWSGRNVFAERSECLLRNGFGPLGLYPRPCTKTATGHNEKAMRVKINIQQRRRRFRRRGHRARRHLSRLTGMGGLPRGGPGLAAPALYRRYSFTASVKYCS